MNFRSTSVATAVVLFLTSFTPSQAFQMPEIRTPAIVDAQAGAQSQSDTAINVQYWRDRDRRGYRDRDFRRGPQRDGYYNGHRGYRDRRPGYRQHNGFWFPLAAFATGAIIGGAASQPRPAYGSSHQSWCQNRWRSYRAYDNTYQPNNGPRRQCVSPY